MDSTTVNSQATVKTQTFMIVSVITLRVWLYRDQTHIQNIYIMKLVPLTNTMRSVTHLPRKPRLTSYFQAAQLHSVILNSSLPINWGAFFLTRRGNATISLVNQPCQTQIVDQSNVYPWNREMFLLYTSPTAILLLQMPVQLTHLGLWYCHSFFFFPSNGFKLIASQMAPISMKADTGIKAHSHEEGLPLSASLSCYISSICSTKY